MVVSRLTVTFLPKKEPARITQPPSGPRAGHSSGYIADAQEHVRASLERGCFAQDALAWLHGKPVPMAYCSMLPTDALDDLVRQMVADLHRFEMRVRALKPAKARSRRRLVTGLRESLRHAEMGHLRLLVVAIDVDGHTRSLQEWSSLQRTARERAVPVVFALTRRDLAATLGRHGTSTSVVGVLNADGALSLYQQIATLSLEATDRWMACAAELLLSDLQSSHCDHLHVLSYFGHLLALRSAFAADPAAFGKMINYMSAHSGATALFFACSGRQSETVDYLLTAGADPLTRNFSLQSPLHVCASTLCIHSLQLIIARVQGPERSASLLAKDAAGLDVLEYAIAAGSPEAVEHILAHLEQSALGHLLLATKSDLLDEKIFVPLLGKFSPRDDEQLAVLVVEVSKVGGLECLRRMVLWMKSRRSLSDEQIRCIVDVPLDKGKSAIWWAAYLGQIGVARFLERLGASADRKAPFGGGEISAAQLLERFKGLSLPFGNVHAGPIGQPTVL